VIWDEVDYGFSFFHKEFCFFKLRNSEGYFSVKYLFFSSFAPASAGAMQSLCRARNGYALNSIIMKRKQKDDIVLQIFLQSDNMKTLKKLVWFMKIPHMLRWILNIQNDVEHERSKRYISKMGKYIASKEKLIISELKYLELGDLVLLGKNVEFRGAGTLKIGSNTVIGHNVMVITSNHNYEKPKWLPFDDGIDAKDNVIGENVWIGNNVIITPGVKIGDGAVIGAGSVVSRDVPPLGVAAGNPAKVVKYRDEEGYRKAKEFMDSGGMELKMEFMKSYSGHHYRIS